MKKVQSLDFNDAAKDVGRQRVQDAVTDAADRFGKAARTNRSDDLYSARPHYVQKNDGLYFMGVDNEGSFLQPVWVCTPLQVLAKTRDRNGSDWGRLLSWSDSDGGQHEWACPSELLVGDKQEFMRRIARDGVELSTHPKTAQRLVAYITTEQIETRAICVPCPGWHQKPGAGGSENGLYVLPTGEAFGMNDGERVVFQHTSAEPQRYAVAGTLDEWKAKVAALCVGNSRLMFGVSAMFAGPLLHIAGLKGGGFNLLGVGAGTSIGKTTILNVAASVAGGPDYMRGWRTTANGLESIAVLHNDATTLLDDMGESDARQIGEMAYMLANGGGKSRADRAGDGRAIRHWKTLILSTGETGLAEHMASVNMRARPGQVARMVDIPAEVERGHGSFENLHGSANGGAFAKRLQQEAAVTYGTALPAWLTRLTAAERSELERNIREQMATWKAAHLPESSPGEIDRVADRFALVAIAGELATDYGLTGWPKGSAINAAGACFQAWIKYRGGTSSAKELALFEQVKAFFDEHADSRLKRIIHGKIGDYFEEKTVYQLAGYKKVDDNKKGIFIIPSTMFSKQVCSGFSSRWAAKLLAKKGLIETAANGDYTITHRIPDGTRGRYYVFLPWKMHPPEPSNEK
jgi:putative DNA primase/helicase